MIFYKEDKLVKDAIITLLKNNNNEMPEKKVCEILGINRSSIPWGHNIGYARCLQSNQENNIILSGSIDDEEQT